MIKRVFLCIFQCSFIQCLYCTITITNNYQSHTKRGIASSNKNGGRITPQEKPGDPKVPGTFINIESNEQKIGSYLGFNDIVNIRRLALLWHVLKACLHFEKIAHHMNKNKAFRLLRDSEDIFSNVNHTEKWPILDTDNTDQLYLKKARHLAAILLRLERDFGVMRAASQAENNK